METGKTNILVITIVSFVTCMVTLADAQTKAPILQPTSLVVKDRKLPRNDPSVVKAAIGPEEISAHYELDRIHAKWTGKGQHIAILNYDKVTPQISASISDFFAHVIKTKTQVVWHGQGSQDDTSPTELEVDIEMAALFAPDAIIDVYSFAQETTTPDDVVLATILNDSTNPEMKIFTSSWGPCEGEQATSVKSNADNILVQAASRGITIMYAAGDYGLSCNNTKEHDPEGRHLRSWPTANPNITAVGATSFYGPDREDVAWRYSGGGPSKDYPMPFYQIGKLPDNYHTKNGGHRGISDIAMLGGDPGIRTWSMAPADPRPGWYVARGTSYASPELAGFIALVNQARLAHGLSTIGALNHRLYCMSERNLTQTMKTITQVDPQVQHVGRTLDPSATWNAMTGLGTPRMQELFDYLTSPESDTDESCVAK